MTLRLGDPESTREDAYYIHSGKLNAAGVILPAIGGLAVVIAAGPIAGTFKLVGSYFIDVGFLGFLFTGFLAGLLTGKVVKITKTRNERFCFWLGIAVGLLHVLSAWFWFYVILQFGDVYAQTGLPNGVFYPWEAPERVLTLIHTYVFQEGKRGQFAFVTVISAIYTRIFYVTIEFPNFSGAWLYALWIFEAIIIVVWTGDTCKRTAGKHGFVFCDACNHEAAILFKSPLLQPMPTEDNIALSQFRNKLEKGDFKTLEAIPVAGTVTEPGDFSRLILRGCEKCHDFYCADIARVEVKWESNYYQDVDICEIDNEDDLVIEHLLLPTVWYERLSSCFCKTEVTATPASGRPLT